MGRAYFYFAATLPMITWDSRPPMTGEDFLSECRRLMNEQDYMIVNRIVCEEADLESPTGNYTADAWIHFNHHFRNELAFFRAQRAGKDPIKYIRGSKSHEPQIREVVHQASKMPNLMEAQRLLDKFCWDFLTDLEAQHYYDLESILVYGLKLKILERHQEYNSPKGRSVLDELKTTELHESCILDTGRASR